MTSVETHMRNEPVPQKKQKNHEVERFKEKERKAVKVALHKVLKELKNNHKKVLLIAEKEAKTAAAKKKKETKAREMAENKKQKSAEAARKKVLKELQTKHNKIRLAAEKEEKKIARIAAQREQRIADRDARIAAFEAQRIAQQAAYQAQRAAERTAAQNAAHNNTLMLSLKRQARADRNTAPLTFEQLTCAPTAFHTHECPICLENIGDTNCMILRCGHKTCGDCILRHFQTIGGRKCPICRNQFAVRVQGWLPPMDRNSIRT